jgi:hypothetical protein
MAADGAMLCWLAAPRLVVCRLEWRWWWRAGWRWRRWQGHSGCGDGASGLAACRRSMALAVERRLATSVVVVVVVAAVVVAPAGRAAGGSRWRAVVDHMVQRCPAWQQRRWW